MRYLIVFYCLFASLFSLSQPVFSGELIIESAWINEAPPTATVMAGYVNLKNTTDDGITINRLSASNFERIEIHETQFKYGIAHMKRQDTITVNAGASMTLRPGEKHLMFINPEKPLLAGDIILVTISLDNGSQLQQKFKVVRLDKKQAHGHCHH